MELDPFVAYGIVVMKERKCCFQNLVVPNNGNLEISI